MLIQPSVSKLRLCGFLQTQKTMWFWGQSWCFLFLRLHSKTKIYIVQFSSNKEGFLTTLVYLLISHAVYECLRESTLNFLTSAWKEKTCSQTGKSSKSLQWPCFKTKCIPTKCCRRKPWYSARKGCPKMLSR